MVLPNILQYLPSPVRLIGGVIVVVQLIPLLATQDASN
jgi:hypothetical protein